MRLGRLDSATQALQRGRGQGLIDGATLGGLCMETLKRMLRRRSAGRERAWEYFRCMQKIDAANVRHYTKMLQTCNDASEIDGLMAELDRSGIRPNAGTAPLVFPLPPATNLAPRDSDLHDAAQGLRSPGHVRGGRQRVEDSPAQGSARHQWRR